MTTPIFYFSSDTDSGMSTQLFTDRAALVHAILESVESYDTETAAAMRALPFESDAWSHLWCEHVEEQEKKSNFFHFGTQSIDLPDTTETWRGAFVMRAPMISTAHITPQDRARLAQNDLRDVLAVVENGIGHIVYFTRDEIEDDFSGFSQPFRALLQVLSSDGFEYVRLEADGHIIPGLPTFNFQA